MKGEQELDDASRRDVLESLVGAIAMPAVADVADLEDGDQQQSLPDKLDDSDPFWVILYWASEIGDPQEVEDKWLPILATFISRGMDEDEMWDWIYAAARGEYDEEALKRRCAYVWGLHTR